MRVYKWTITALATVVVATGCQSGGVGSHDVSAGAMHDEAAADPGSDYKKELDRIAMRGLSYESGRVEIDAPVADEMVPNPNPALAPALREQGLIELYSSNDRHAAIAALSRAVINDPAEPASYQALGRALLFKGKLPESEAAFRTALDLDPQFCEAGFQLGAMLQMAGRNAEALNQWLSVVQMDPNHGEAHSRLAIELYYAGRYDEAWQHVHAAQRLGIGVPAQFLPLLSAKAAEPVQN
jgi:tetratricopeptide (TPR) repeat protein